MGRYTLNVEAFGITSPVLVREDGKLKQKVALPTIDALTLGSKPSIVLQQLNFDQAVVSDEAKLYITYLSKGQLQRLQVLFDDAYGLKSIASLGKSEIDMDNKEFNSFIDKIFIPMLDDFKFMQFLRTNNFLSQKLDEYISYFYENKYSKDFCVYKIKKYASRYKQFRGLVVSIKLYKEQASYASEQVEDERDPDRYFGLFSPEERNAYEQEMNNLPDGFNVHAK